MESRRDKDIKQRKEDIKQRKDLNADTLFSSIRSSFESFSTSPTRKQ
jgi:hypothetical protein